MGIGRSVKRLWHRAPSGLVVPGGVESRILQTSSQTLLDLKAKASAIEALYAAAGVRLPLASDLARMIADAKSVSDRWLGGRPPDANTALLVFRALMLDSIGDALLMLEAVPTERGSFRRSLPDRWISSSELHHHQGRTLGS